MDEKVFEFKTTIYGVQKNFRVYGKDYNDARKKVDARILESLVITEHKEVTPKKDFSMDKIFEQFGEIFGGNFFGKKK